MPSPIDYFASEEYKKDFPFPKDDVDPKEKSSAGEWYMRYFKAIYSEYVRDRGGIPYSRRNDFNIARLYSDGNQPTEKYMDILAPVDPNTMQRSGFMNISWDIVSVAPKFKRIFIGNFEKLEHDTICTSVNDKALSEKEDFKWNLWASKELADYFSELSAKTGIEIPPPQSDFVPENIKELEMFMDECFKTVEEMSFEIGIDFAFYLSSWPDVKKKMLADAFTLGVMACQDYEDPIDNKIKCRYIDPTRLIIRYSEDPHFKNIDHWGYIDEITISELRQISSFSEEELFDIAKNYCNYAENRILFDFNYSDYYSVNAVTSRFNAELPYDNYRVNVMFAEMISTNTEVYNTRKTSDGAERTYKEAYNYTKRDNEKRKVERHRYQTVYKGWWVIGTKYMYNCGEQYNIPRPEKKRPALSLNIYRNAYKSILQSIIPNLDSFQISWLKLQNAKAMANPSGLAIETGTLENISIDGNVLSPLELLTIRRQTGDLLYKATTHHSEVNSPNAGKPVTELSGGIGEQLNEFIAAMEYDLNMIRQQTGINEVIDSSSPDPNQPVRNAMLAVQAANNSLQPIYSGYVTIKEQASKKIALRYQIQARSGDISGYIPGLGGAAVKVFKITSDMSLDDMAIKIQLRPTDEMKAAIRAQVQRAVDLGPKNGGISASDALYIEDKIENGNLKYARMYLAYRERTYQKAAEKMQSDNMALNGQNMAQQEQLKSQAAMGEIEAKRKAEADKIALESSLKMKENEQLHEYKMREIALQGQNQINAKVVETASSPENNS